jgi:hypothetical protein
MNKTIRILGITALLAITLTTGVLAGSVIGGVASAQGPAGGQFGFGGMMGSGRGMMGGYGWNAPAQNVTNTVPFGGLGGFGGMMDGFRGMMGGWGQGNQPFQLNATPIPMDQAVNAAQGYLASYNNPDLILDEVMEFDNNFYVIVKEKSTGVSAFEILVDRYSGYVHPEPGPNMMWNTKYGHMGTMMRDFGGMMGGWQGGYSGNLPTTQMPVSLAEARTAAQTYLSSALPGTSLSDSTNTFYGYYTLDLVRDGKVYGMLSINGYGGQVWYHSWHGTFIQEKELS